GRGGCCSRVQDRRAGCRRQGRGHRLPRGGASHQRLPDRRPQGQQGRRHRSGLRRPGPVRAGRISADGGGVRRAVTAAARGRPSRRRLSTGLPGALVPLAVVAVLFLVVPVVGLLVRTPWSTLVEVLTREESLQALRLSLVCASLATAVCLVLGVPLAWVLARGDFPGRSVLRALVIVPLVLPPRSEE